jgi:hypothetical protein
MVEREEEDMRMCQLSMSQSEESTLSVILNKGCRREGADTHALQGERQVLIDDTASRPREGGVRGTGGERTNAAFERFERGDLNVEVRELKETLHRGA